jgi:nucleotide-binding universal stress UspA family protein
MNSTFTADPLILCYDGSDHAKRAVEEAAELFPGAHTLVLTIWKPVSNVESFGWPAATAGTDLAALNREAAEQAGAIAEEGVEMARRLGLEAEKLAVEAAGSVSEAVVETADEYRARIVVLGSRGLTGLRSMLLGSVSSAVVRHARQPTLVVHLPEVASRHAPAEPSRDHDPQPSPR